MMPPVPIDGRCPKHGKPIDSSDGKCRECRMIDDFYDATILPFIAIPGVEGKKCAAPGEDMEIIASAQSIAKVVSLADKRAERTPHLSGEARCMLCGREWVAVAPIGTPWLECPGCHSEKGYMKFHVQRTGPEWICNCGNDLFRVTPDGYYCPNCGTRKEPR